MEKSEKRLTAFGSTCHLVIGSNDDTGEALLLLCQEELLRLEKKFCSYHYESITSQLNRGAGTGCTVPLDAETHSLFAFVNALWTESNHLFDPTTRILQDCYDGAGTLKASQEQLQRMLKLVGWGKVALTEEGAQLETKGMLIDLNSCVRPYALDSLRKLLLNRGVENAYVEMGQDAISIGKQPDGANWLTGVRIPKGSRAAIVRFKMNNQGFAVRGDFEKASLQNGERFGRALSPIDGQPTPGLLGVAVIAENCLTACSAASIARLKTEATGIKWLDKVGLPWMAIDRQLRCHGPLAPAH